MLTGDFLLPSGMTVDDVVHDWIPAGTPWWNPKDEIAADLQSVEGNLRTREEIRKALRRRLVRDDAPPQAGRSVPHRSRLRPVLSAVRVDPRRADSEKEQPVAGEGPDDVPAAARHKPQPPAAEPAKPAGAVKGGADAKT